MSAGLPDRFEGLPRRTLANGRVVIDAESHTARRRGLARLDALPADHALRIPRCPAVHTFGMRFALDLIWLDKAAGVVRIDRDVPPRRMRMCPRARTVVETLAGEADAFIEAGLARSRSRGAT
jgi:uncharacterized protein